MLDVNTTKKLLKLQSKVLVDYTRRMKVARKTGTITGKESWNHFSPAWSAAVRRQECRSLARLIHVAKCLLRGRTMEQIEGKSQCPVDPNHPIMVALMAGEIPDFSKYPEWMRIYDGNLLAFHQAAVKEFEESAADCSRIAADNFLEILA